MTDTSCEPPIHTWPDPVCPLERAFRTSLDENHRDGETRAAYSDWLEEQGRISEAAFQRLALGQMGVLAIQRLDSWYRVTLQGDFHFNGAYRWGFGQIYLKNWKPHIQVGAYWPDRMVRSPRSIRFRETGFVRDRDKLIYYRDRQSLESEIGRLWLILGNFQEKS